MQIFTLPISNDKTLNYSRTFIEEKMGAKYVENRTVEFSKSFEETSPSTPIFFILSPGVNPLKDVEALGKVMGFTADNGNFHNVSLGQGQEIVAEQAMDESFQNGHWVVLQVFEMTRKAIFRSKNLFLVARQTCLFRDKFKT